MPLPQSGGGVAEATGDPPPAEQAVASTTLAAARNDPQTRATGASARAPRRRATGQSASFRRQGATRRRTPCSGELCRAFNDPVHSEVVTTPLPAGLERSRRRIRGLLGTVLLATATCSLA